MKKELRTTLYKNHASADGLARFLYQPLAAIKIMKNLKQSFLLVVTSICLYACSEEKIADTSSIRDEAIHQTKTNLEESLFKSDTTYEFNIEKPSADTFKLVSHSWYFWYPFGKFTNPEELKKHFKGKFEIFEETSPSKSEHSGKATLYRLKLKDGFIKFYHTTWDEGSENNDMAIVSGKITDPSIQMTNGLKVGLTRDEVKRILFKNGEPKDLRNYNNLLIMTALQGIWLHLNFESDKLNRIIIDTDYQLNKE